MAKMTRQGTRMSRRPELPDTHPINGIAMREPMSYEYATGSEESTRETFFVGERQICATRIRQSAVIETHDAPRKGGRYIL